MTNIERETKGFNFAGKSTDEIGEHFKKKGWVRNKLAPTIDDAMITQGDAKHGEFWHGLFDNPRQHKDVLILLSDVLILRCNHENADIVLYTKKAEN